MPRFQTLIFFSLLFFSAINSGAATCADSSIHAWVENRNNVIMMILNPGSRDEVRVHLPETVQLTLKTEVGRRIQLDAPTEKKDDFLYTVYYQDERIRIYPFTSETKDQVQSSLNRKPCPVKIH
ncbi:MAG: hypothetical protein ACXWRE_07355 [Pseudobdellovibrionaceae bacterium]